MTERSGLSRIEREKALDAERVRRQDAAGWTRGAHIPGTSIDWRAEALALEARLAGAVGALREIEQSLLDAKNMPTIRQVDAAIDEALVRVRALIGGQ